MAGPTTDVFLSYKAEDRSRLVPLVKALEEGFSVWWDAQIGGGTNWHEDIEQHLDAAICVVVAWSKRSVSHEGHFVRDEARRAQRRDAYVPVCLDPVDPPLGFGEIQALSIKGWKGDRSDPRFQAVVDAIRAHISGEHIAHHAHVPFREPRLSRRATIAGGIGVGAIAVAGTGGWLLLRPVSADAKRIAVLPFANLSGDPAQAYFSDGIAEELRGALSRIGLEVIGRTSSDAVRELDAKQAAAKLGVANILTGSVRRSPQTIRIGAQLIAGDDGVERWAQSYDRAPGDTIKIQTDIAASVAKALSVALGMTAHGVLTLGGTSDSVAQDLFLKADALRRKGDSEETWNTVLGLLDAAIARDPDYADAHVEKSIALEVLAAQFAVNPADRTMKLVQAEQAARKAIAIAPRLGGGYAMLGLIATVRLEFGEALAMTRRALAESPNSPRVLKSTASTLIYLGDGDEALAHLTRGISLDPLDATFHVWRAMAYYYSRRYNQAIDDARKALSVAPERQSPHVIIGDSIRELGKFAEAQAEYRKMPADDFFRIVGEAIVAARTGDRAGAATRIARLQQSDGDAASYQYGQIHAQLGEADRAFAALDKAMEVKDPGLMTVKKDPVMDPIRGDPRYAALLKKLNFPS